MFSQQFILSIFLLFTVSSIIVSNFQRHFSLLSILSNVYNMPFLNDTQYNNLNRPYVDLMFALNIGEFFLIICSIIIFSTMNLIVMSLPLLHKNFMRIYGCVLISFGIFTLPRLIQLIGMFLNIEGFACKLLRDNPRVRSNHFSSFPTFITSIKFTYLCFYIFSKILI